MTSAASLVLPDALLLRGPTEGALTIGLLAPLSGVMGISGPSIVNYALLAAEHIAERGDVLPELVLIDAGRGPQETSRVVNQLVSTGLVRGLVGAHTSDIREAVSRVIGERVPYVFTPPHEQDWGRSGTIFIGSGPRLQLQRPLEWIIARHQVRRWALIGSDYVWPRQVHRTASGMLQRLGQTVVLEQLFPLGFVDTERFLDEARKHRADAILLSLVGRDGITFHRDTTGIGAGQRFVRLCTTLDENSLLAAGGDTTGLLYSAMPSFMGQRDERQQSLLELYLRRFGVSAPLPASYAQGCYEGVVLLAQLWLSGLLDGFSPAAAVRRLLSTAGAAGPAFVGSAGSQLALAVQNDLLVI